MSFVPHEPASIKLGKSTLDEVSALAIGGTTIAAVVDGGVQLVGWPKLRRIGKPKIGVVDVAFSADGQHLAMASGDAGKVAMGVARTFPSTGHPVHAVAFSPDGARVAVGGHQRVHVYDIATGRELVVWQACERAVMRVAWSPDGAHVATRSWDDVGWFDAATGRSLAAISGVVAEDADLAFLPDGRLATAIDDTAVGVWTLKGPPLRIPIDGLVRSLAVSPTVIAIEDRQLRIQLLTPALEPLELLEGCINQIHSIAISHDGRIVLAGDGNRLAAWRHAD